MCVPFQIISKGYAKILDFVYIMLPNTLNGLYPPEVSLCFQYLWFHGSKYSRQ